MDEACRLHIRIVIIGQAWVAASAYGLAMQFCKETVLA